MLVCSAGVPYNPVLIVTLIGEFLLLSAPGFKIATHISFNSYTHPSTIAEELQYAFHPLPAQGWLCSLLTEKRHHSGRVQFIHDEYGPSSRRRKPRTWADMRTDRRLDWISHVIMFPPVTIPRQAPPRLGEPRGQMTDRRSVTHSAVTSRPLCCIRCAAA